MNGDDRWPNVLSRRLAAPRQPRRRGQCRHRRQPGGRPGRVLAAEAVRRRAVGGARFERDVLSLSGVTAVIWLEGINDFSRNGNATVEAVQDAHEGGRGAHARENARHRVYRRDRRRPALDATNAAHGSARAGRQAEGAERVHPRRRACSTAWSISTRRRSIRRPASCRPEFVPESTTGGPGDKLHPNRAGYLAMGNAIDLDMVMAKQGSASVSASRSDSAPTGSVVAISIRRNCTRSSPFSGRSTSVPAACTMRPRFSHQRIAERLAGGAERDRVEHRAVARAQPRAHMRLPDLLGVGDRVRRAARTPARDGRRRTARRARCRFSIATVGAARAETAPSISSAVLVPRLLDGLVQRLLQIGAERRELVRRNRHAGRHRVAAALDQQTRRRPRGAPPRRDRRR